MHALEPGQICEEGCGANDASLLDSRGLPIPLHSKVPIEGAGVVHVTTQPLGCPAGSWESVVTLWRYTDGEVEEKVALTDTFGGAGSAWEMHTYWCDIETLALCVQGKLRGLVHLHDLDYFERKQRELFGRQE